MIGVVNIFKAKCTTINMISDFITPASIKADSHYRHNVMLRAHTLRSAIHTAFAHYVNFTLIKHKNLPYYK